MLEQTLVQAAEAVALIRQTLVMNLPVEETVGRGL
jgi:hypothetical protein